MSAKKTAASALFLFFIFELYPLGGTFLKGQSIAGYNSDGVTDDIDNCIWIPNPSQPESDGDGSERGE